MKCHVNIQLSTKVCHILTKKNHTPPFLRFPFPFFLLFHFVPHCFIFLFFFPGTIPPPPLAIVFCKISTPVPTCNVGKRKLIYLYFIADAMSTCINSSSYNYNNRSIMATSPRTWRPFSFLDQNSKYVLILLNQPVQDKDLLVRYV